MSTPGPPGRGMQFAETQLRRHGWRRGQGLGKRQDGIAEAIRVKVKCDTAGVGHDAAEPFTFHWWDHVFNKAAANIAVEAGQDGISVKALSEQGGRISNKKPRKASSTRDLLYGRFVKSATLTACGEESVTLPTSSESSEEEEKLDLSSARRLTDEELVQACGGRTAHKGARHGLTMSAKLARLEEQERAFLATYQHKERQQEPLESSPLAESQAKKKKKKKQSEKKDRTNPEVPQSQEPNGEEGEVSGKEEKVVKKKKNQQSGREEQLTGEEEKVLRKKKVTEPCGEEEVSGEEGKVRKRRKKPDPSTEQEVAGEESKAAKRKKKKKKQQQEEDKEELPESDIPLEDTSGPDLGHSPRKKRKKKKRKREPE